MSVDGLKEQSLTSTIWDMIMKTCENILIGSMNHGGMIDGQTKLFRDDV